MRWWMHHATPENEKKSRRRTKGKKAQDGVESGSEQPSLRSPQLWSVFILVILSHQLDRLPSCRAVSPLMLRCGWEAESFRTEGKRLLNNSNSQQRHASEGHGAKAPSSAGPGTKRHFRVKKKLKLIIFFFLDCQPKGVSLKSSSVVLIFP